MEKRTTPPKARRTQSSSAKRMTGTADSNTNNPSSYPPFLLLCVATNCVVLNSHNSNAREMDAQFVANVRRSRRRHRARLREGETRFSIAVGYGAPCSKCGLGKNDR